MTDTDTNTKTNTRTDTYSKALCSLILAAVSVGSLGRPLQESLHIQMGITELEAQR